MTLTPLVRPLRRAAPAARTTPVRRPPGTQAGVKPPPRQLSPLRRGAIIRRKLDWRRLRVLLAISLLLHLALLALIFLSPREKPPSETSVPSEVEIVMEPGRPEATALPPPEPPAPSPDQLPQPAPEQPPPLVPPTPAPLPPSQLPSAPPAPMPEALSQPAQPAPVAPPPSTPTPPAPSPPEELALAPAPRQAPPLTQAPAPSPELPPLTVPEPTPPSPAPLPERRPPADVRLTPQERQQAAPLLQAPAPVPIPQAPPLPPPAPAARPAPAFPTPQDWSLNGPTRAAPARRKLDLALDPKSLMAPAEPDIKFKGEVGAAWRDGFKAWVEARKYYPEAAIEMGQQGSSTVRIVITRDGTVRSVSLLDSSHSPFLDMAWLGLFRGAHLPAFPPGTNDPEITIDATMHYILIR